MNDTTTKPNLRNGYERIDAELTIDKEIDHVYERLTHERNPVYVRIGDVCESGDRVHVLIDALGRWGDSPQVTIPRDLAESIDAHDDDEEWAATEYCEDTISARDAAEMAEHPKLIRKDADELDVLGLEKSSNLF